MKEPKIRLPVRYVPKNLTKKDKQKQLNMLLKSRRLYKKNKYYARKHISLFISYY